MGAAKKLLEQFSAYAVYRSGTSLFCAQTAVEIITRCEKAKLRIYGMDGYFLTEQQQYSRLSGFWI